VALWSWSYVMHRGEQTCAKSYGRRLESDNSFRGLPRGI
jgi:hypothetical protein